jgi:hypothetical protein
LLIVAVDSAITLLPNLLSRHKHSKGTTQQEATAHTTEKLKALSAKSLSSRMETHVVAVSSKDDTDQFGQHGNRDLKLQTGKQALPG